MDLQVSVSPDHELLSLRDWLNRESDLRGRVRAPGYVPSDGHLGAVTDVLVIAVGAGGAVSVLAGSLQAWLNQPRRADVRITIREPDGRSIEVDAKHVDDMDAFLRRALPSAPQE